MCSIIRLGPVHRGVDIEHDQFVGFLLIEYFHGIDGISDVFGIPESNGLHQSAVVNQKARGNAGSKHQDRAKFCSRAAPKWWLFSGWNWTP